MYQLLNSFRPTDTSVRCLRNIALPVVAVLLASVFPRMMLLGGLPSTDEGYYAYYAQLIHHSISSGHGLPDEGPLMLYPMLLAWVFDFSTNPFILLRIADLFVAAMASWLLYRILVAEIGSSVGGTLVGIVFIFSMNQTLFIQFGFKNSMSAALIPLLAAVRLCQTPNPAVWWRWALAGALTALALLLRETFLPFALLGAIAIAVAHGSRAVGQFVTGGLLLGLTTLLAIVASRGGYDQLVAGYRSASLAYAAAAVYRNDLFIDSGWATLKDAAIPVAFTTLSLFVYFFVQAIRPQPARVGRLAFWLAAALLPLLEPLTKIGYPYHFAVCLPGLAGLSAFGWKHSTSAIPALRSGLIMAASACGLLLLPKAGTLATLKPSVQDVLLTAPSGGFPQKSISQSNYLLAAEAIRREAPTHATLSVSGFMYTLYPLTGLLPPAPAMANLTTLLINLEQDGNRFRQALLACPPDLLMTSTRADWPGAKTLSDAVDASGIYQKVATIPESSDRAYGNFGGDIYRRVTQTPMCKPPRLDTAN